MREENKKEDDSKEYYEVSFDSGHSLGQDHSVRGLKCNQIGRLISLKGTVTRTSEVRPELKIGVFKCKVCGKLSKPITQQFKYT
jgi:DNA replication licensing factor MCM6